MWNNYNFASLYKKTTMKKIGLLLFVFGLATTSFAQSMEVTNCGIELQRISKSVNGIPLVLGMAIQSKDAKLGEFKTHVLEAKKQIDISAKKQAEGGVLKPKVVSKYHYYRGITYMAYAMLGSTDDQLKADVETNGEKYGEIMSSSFKSSIEAGDNYKEDIERLIKGMAGQAMSQGGVIFGEGEYETAFEMYESAIEMYDIIGVKESDAYYNAGLAADNSKQYDNAVKYYRLAQGASDKYGVKIFQMMIQVVNRKNDNKPSEESLKLIQEAKSKFPGDLFLSIEEFNYYYMSGDTDKAQASLQEAIKADPNNPILHFNIGVTFDEMATKKHTEKDQKSAEDFAAKSIEAYKKAIELDAKYFDAYYNLGALYNNESFELGNVIQDIVDQVLYDSEQKRALKMLEDAVPYLEKAHELDPKDVNTLKILKSIFFNIDNSEKYNAVEAKLKELGQ